MRSLPVVGLVPAIFLDGRPPVLGRSPAEVACLKLVDHGHTPGSRWAPTVAVRRIPLCPVLAVDLSTHSISTLCVAAPGTLPSPARDP